MAQRRIVADISFVLGFVGLFLVVMDTELHFANVHDTRHVLSTSLKVMISASTFMLLVSVVFYHVTGLRLRMASAGVESWHLAMTKTKLAKLLLELVVCAIHPLPYLEARIPTILVKEDGSKWVLSETSMPLNGIFTIMMTFRMYLLARFVVVHSKLFLDTSVQSLGALSKVNINAQFVFRALMSSEPGMVLSTIMLSFFLLNSWNLRVCELYTNNNSSLGDFSQAMWLTAVTFLTVGYGDLLPESACGRVISAWTGVMGVGSMALSVAVLAKKLEQTRSEKYVHTFVQQIALDKERRHHAADVVKQALKLWQIRRADPPNVSMQMMRHRSKMVRAIQKMKASNDRKIHLQEGTVGFVELQTAMSDVQGLCMQVKEDQRALTDRVATLENLSVTIMGQVLEIKEMVRPRTSK